MSRTPEPPSRGRKVFANRSTLDKSRKVLKTRFDQDFNNVIYNGLDDEGQHLVVDN